MPADLIIYALVAAGLIFWLRSVLGTRHGDETDRSVPYLKPEGDGEDAKGILGAGNKMSAEDRIAEFAKNPKGNASIENKTAELGLLEIAAMDKNFDIYHFVQAAQDAFVYVVESFADGDRETLKELLAPDVYDAFDQAITAREKAGEVMHKEINAINKAEIVAAGIDGKYSKITMRFVAEEVSYTKNENGEIIEGHPDKATKMRDLWTFSRETKSSDPRWIVIETRADLEDDNNTIPNTVA